MNSTFESRYFSGAELYGDDFDEARIRQWYAEEEHAYFDLVSTYSSFVYFYNALNDFHAYRFLGGPYECCVAMGCATGDDVAPLGNRVDHFVAIEPAEKWWKAEIGGRPARYLKPTYCGDIPMVEASADLVVCLGVLHHVPNVSHVLSEMVRILRPGGTMVIREPITTMGDWRSSRRGLTQNERGFPPGWLKLKVATLGLRVKRAGYCHFPLTERLAKMFGMPAAYNSPLMVRLDALMSRLFVWNLHYHRETIFKKVAPGSITFVLEKPSTS
jgi:SAM-dependent methyltransferase